jgi:predicted permease
VSQVGGIVRPSTLERDLDEEHAFHVAKETERLVREGLEPGEARRQALVSFGGVERFQQQVREARWTWSLEQAWRDARLALRALRRRPLFAASAVGTMAVAIGAATVFFSAVDALLLRPLPVPGAGRLVGVELANAGGGTSGVVSLPDYLDYRDQAADVLDLAAHRMSDVTLSNDGAAQASQGAEVSTNYFRVLGLTPAAGRFFVDGEAERLDAPAEVVLAYDTWRARFGSDPEVVGRTLHVNGQPLTIVGVGPEGFSGTMVPARPAVFLPLGLHGRLTGRDITERLGTQWLLLFGRLAPGAVAESASEAITLTAGRLASAYDYHESAEPRGAIVRRFSPLPGSQREIIGRSTLILLTAALLLLLIATVNVAGMLLARATQRGREISLRLALGAGRSRLVAQLVVEGLVLGALAGAAGVAVAALGMRLVGGIRPPGIDGFRLDLPLDLPAFAFAVAAACAAGLVFGLVPAYHATHRDLGGVIRRGSGSRSGALARSALVGAQVALTLVLLVSTALLLRTLRNALATDHGFQPEGVVLAEVNLRLNGYDGVRGQAFFAELLERLEATPGIESAALATSYPLGSGWDETRASVPGVEAPEPSGWPVGWSAITEGYFETLGFELRSGTGPDATATPPTIVVNDALASLFWNGEPAVGRAFRFNGSDAAVAGVAPTGKYRSFSEEPTLYAWFPPAASTSSSATTIWSAARPCWSFALSVRTDFRRPPTIAPILVFTSQSTPSTLPKTPSSTPTTDLARTWPSSPRPKSWQADPHHPSDQEGPGPRLPGEETCFEMEPVVAVAREPASAFEDNELWLDGDEDQPVNNYYIHEIHDP